MSDSMNRWIGFMRMIRASMFVLCIVASGEARADEQTVLAEGYCAEMEGDINALVDFTRTKCIPAKDPDGMSFIFVSEKPVLSVPAAFKGWVISVTAIFGDTFNKNNFKTSAILVTDIDHAADKKGFRIHSKTARTLQRQVKADQITLEQYYEGIKADLTPYTVQ